MVERYNEKWKSIFGGVLGGKEWTHDCVTRRNGGFGWFIN